MKEIPSQEEQVKDASKRRLLKIVGIAVGSAAASFALGGIIGNEVNKSEHGIITDSGIFYPVYNRHDIGIDVKDIPKDIDFFFSEGFGIGGLFQPPAKYLLQTELRAYPGSVKEKNVKFLKDEVLNILARNRVELMLGDTHTDISEFYRLVRIEQVLAGLTIFGLAAESYLSKNKQKQASTRRKIIKTGVIGAGGWLLLSSPAFDWINQLTLTQNKVIKRIGARLVGIASNMHPEIGNKFFRNLVMADKLLIVGEDARRRTGKIPKIAFNVEGGHSGIEDFLQAGDEFCRALILAYPKGWLKKVVEKNNGINDFSSARLFRLPQDFKPEDPYFDKIAERRVIDEKLEKALISKLA